MAAGHVLSLMNAFNSALTALTDWFFSLWARGPAWLPLVVISVATGAMMTIVFRFTSRQDRLRRDHELIQAQLLAMKLFRDDLSTMCGSIGRLLRYTAQRLWHSLPPVLVMMVPFVLLLAQLARWFEHAPLVPGDEAIVAMRLSEDGWHQFSGLELESADGFEVRTPSLRDETQRALYWRIRVTSPRIVGLRWQLTPQIVKKNVAVAYDRQQLMGIDTERVGSHWVSRLLHPGEPSFDRSDAVQAIVVYHPQRSTPIFGIDLPWWATLLVLSMLTALLMGRIMKVHF